MIFQDGSRNSRFSTNFHLNTGGKIIYSLIYTNQKMSLTHGSPTNPEPNTFYYKTISGSIKSHRNNAKYIHKKPQTGCVKGTSLTSLQVKQILQKRSSGTKVRELQQQFGLSHYYIDKAIQYGRNHFKYTYYECQ